MKNLMKKNYYPINILMLSVVLTTYLGASGSVSADTICQCEYTNAGNTSSTSCPPITQPDHDDAVEVCNGHSKSVDANCFRHCQKLNPSNKSDTKDAANSKKCPIWGECVAAKSLTNAN